MWTRLSPTDWVVRVGSDGQVLSASQGASFWQWPWQSHVRFPSTIQWMLFSASQITRENQGVDVKGAFSWRVTDPILAYQNLNMTYMGEGETKELLGKRSSTADSCGVDHGPLMRTTLLIRQLAESVTRNAIANMTLEETLRDRRSIVDMLTRQIDTVIGKWGVAITSIEIVDIFISSKEVFAHMQADHREKLRQEARIVQIAADEVIGHQQLQSEARAEKSRHEQALAALALKAQRAVREAELEHQRQAEQAALAMERTIAEAERQKADMEASLERRRLEEAVVLQHKRNLLEVTRQRIDILGQGNEAYRSQQLVAALPRVLAEMKADKTTVFANSLTGSSLEGLATSIMSIAEVAGLKFPLTKG